jgi:hypothetical protein
MPKKAKAKVKKPARGIAVKQKQSVKQTVKVIVGDIAKKPVRRRTAKPKVATIIQPSGGGLSGSVAPEPLREPQPYSFVPDNRQPRYDFERIQPQPIENAKINLLDYKANSPSVSASGLISVAEQQKMIGEEQPVIRDISKEYDAMSQREKNRQAGIVKRKETLAKKKAEQAKMSQLPAIIPSMPDIRAMSSSSEMILVPVKPKRFLGAKELEKGFVKGRDEALVEKIKTFRREQMKKRGLEAFRENRSDNEIIGRKMEKARAQRGLLNASGSKKLKILPTSAVGKKLLEASKKN